MEDPEGFYRSGERSVVFALYQIRMKRIGIIHHFVHFLSRERKHPCDAILRASLCFSNRAGVVELANAQTATTPFSPSSAMLGASQRGPGQNQKTIKPPSRGLPDASRFAGGVVTVFYESYTVLFMQPQGAPLSLGNAFARLHPFRCATPNLMGSRLGLNYYTLFSRIILRRTKGRIPPCSK